MSRFNHLSATVVLLLGNSVGTRRADVFPGKLGINGLRMACWIHPGWSTNIQPALVWCDLCCLCSFSWPSCRPGYRQALSNEGLCLPGGAAGGGGGGGGGGGAGLGNGVCKNRKWKECGVISCRTETVTLCVGVCNGKGVWVCMPTLGVYLCVSVCFHIRAPG